VRLPLWKSKKKEIDIINGEKRKKRLLGQGLQGEKRYLFLGTGRIGRNFPCEPPRREEEESHRHLDNVRAEKKKKRIAIVFSAEEKT